LIYLLSNHVIWFPDYAFGVRLVNNLDGKVHITFNARNDHDRQKFVEDLKEAILEVSDTKNCVYYIIRSKKHFHRKL
jgi:hypothetical protein